MNEEMKAARIININSIFASLCQHYNKYENKLYNGACTHKNNKKKEK